MADLNKADEARLHSVEDTVSRVKVVGIIVAILLVLVLGGTAKLLWTLGSLEEAVATSKTQHAADLTQRAAEIARLDAAIAHLNDRIDKRLTYNALVETIDGKLLSLKDSKLTVQDADGKLHVLTVAPDAKIVVAGKDAGRDDLKAGALVRAHFLVGASVFRIESPPPTHIPAPPP